MRRIALLMSALVLSGCVLTDLGSGKFFGRSSSSQQMAASSQATAMLERVILSCNNGGDSDFSEIVSLLKQQEYQQVSSGYWGGIMTYFYNSSKPLYFLGYPVQYFAFANTSFDKKSVSLHGISIGLPPEAYSRIRPYDGSRAEGKKGADGTPRSLYWSVYRTNMDGINIWNGDEAFSVKYAVLGCRQY